MTIYRYASMPAPTRPSPNPARAKGVNRLSLSREVLE